MQYFFILVLFAYGILNLRYCASDMSHIPASLRFLIAERIPSNRYALFLSVIFSFFPEAKRILVLRLLMAVACFFSAGMMLYARFI